MKGSCRCGHICDLEEFSLTRFQGTSQKQTNFPSSNILQVQACGKEVSFA